MELSEILKSRRSHRLFTDRQVDETVLARIIEGTLTAPSSKSSRSSRFMAIYNKELLERLSSMRSRGSALLKDAPLAVLVMGDTSLTDLWVDNCAISATIMQLCAKDEGLDSCWVHVNGRPHNDNDPHAGSAEDYLRSFLKIDDNYHVLCIVAIGYAADQIPDRKPRHDEDKLIIVR